MSICGCVQNLWPLWDGAPRMKFFLSKSLKTEYAIKSRGFLRSDSNFDTTLILIVRIWWKFIFQKFSNPDPHEEKLQISPTFLIFGPKVPNRDSLIFFHTWNLLAFKMYICVTFWKNFMVVCCCVQYLWSFDMSYWSKIRISKSNP